MKFLLSVHIQLRAQFLNLNKYRKLQNNKQRTFSISRNFFRETTTGQKEFRVCISKIVNEKN